MIFKKKVNKKEIFTMLTSNYPIIKVENTNIGQEI
jgi:hypothetical protein